MRLDMTASANTTWRLPDAPSRPGVARSFAALSVAALLLCLLWPGERVLLWLNPSLPKPDVTERALPAAPLIRRIEAAEPDWRVHQLRLPTAPGQLARATLIDNNGTAHQRLVNPVTGALHSELRGAALNQRMQRARQRLLRTLGAPLPAAFLMLFGYALWSRSLLHRGQPAAASDVAEHPVLVGYASQTGSAEALARQAADALQQAGRQARLLPLNAITAEQLADTREALFLVSTHGDGDPPDNAAVFARRQLPASADLKGLRFGLLALGDRRYTDFCGFGRSLHQWLCQHGASALFPPVEVDDQCPDALMQWQAHLQGLSGQPAVHASDSAATFSAPGVHTATLVRREHLNPGSPGNPVWQVDFDASALPTWEAGDLALLHLDQNETRSYSIASLPGSGVLRLLVRAMYRPDGTPGLGSGLLTRQLAPGEQARISLRSNPGFRPPAADTPLILIGNGTGLAGLLAHLHQRMADGARRNWLLFGERSPRHDRFCNDILDLWVQQGSLHMQRVFSRPFSDTPASTLSYVQDLLPAHADTLREWLADGAVLCVCGSLTMGQGVDQTLRHLLGDDDVDALLAAGRYRRDVY
ncbi:MAG: hypothetical protein C0462_11770 [Alcanivorax sp.]|nr:hypothetical protein [Alcanivorax sp.]